MCTNLRWIYNRHVDKKILVSCGHCEACLQEKANKRATRLKNEYNSKTLVLFVSLGYDRYSCPYVLHSDILNNEPTLPIYRDCSFRTDPVTHKMKRSFKRSILSYAECVCYDMKHDWLPYLRISLGKQRFRYDIGKVGVCLFRDVQDFNKRLRINLKRKYKYNGKYKVYNTFEYGETTQRPHIHLLIYIEPDAYEIFKSAIVKSWPFADRKRTLDNIQIARDAASYVASYVNCGSELPLFIKANFPPKHSFSQGLGVGCDSFQLDSLLENVRRGNMSYNLRSSKDGVPCFVNLPVPKYVINRYFPLFKGYSRLTYGEISDCLQSASSISGVHSVLKKIDYARYRLDHHFEYDFVKSERAISYTFEDALHIGTMLHNSYLRYKRLTGRSTVDYAIDFVNVWNCYKNTIYKRFALDDEPLQYKYDNIFSDKDLVTPRRLSRSIELTKLFYEKCKTRKVNNSVYSNKSIYV